MMTSRITDSRLRSPLREAMRVKPTSAGGRAKKKMVMALILTSLVDAFSIILLYLLVQNTGNGSSLELTRANELPTAVQTEALNQGTMIRVLGDQYLLDEQPVDRSQLAARLSQVLAAKPQTDDSASLIIQADKSVSFASLEPVIRAGSLSGFHKFKFAVLQEEGRL